MVRNNSPAMMFATAIVAGAIGFGAASLLPASPETMRPIVNANAWEETAPAPAAQPIAARVPSAKCDPWEISDIAMEEVLDQMVRRGWRPPNQGDALAALDIAQTSGLAAIDPNAPMPRRPTWFSNNGSDDAINEADATEEPATATEPQTAPAEPAKAEPPPA